MYYSNLLTAFNQKIDVLYSINISKEIERLSYH